MVLIYTQTTVYYQISHLIDDVRDRDFLQASFAFFLFKKAGRNWQSLQLDYYKSQQKIHLVLYNRGQFKEFRFYYMQKKVKIYNLLCVISFRETMNIFNFSNYQNKKKNTGKTSQPHATADFWNSFYLLYCPNYIWAAVICVQIWRLFGLN